MKKERKFTKELLTLSDMMNNFMRNGDPEDCSRVDWFIWDGILGSIGVPTQEELDHKIMAIRQENIMKRYGR